MTTTVPKIFSFPEFAGVAEAVADHIVNCQNLALGKHINVQIPGNICSNPASAGPSSGSCEINTGDSNNDGNHDGDGESATTPHHLGSFKQNIEDSFSNDSLMSKFSSVSMKESSSTASVNSNSVGHQKRRSISHSKKKSAPRFKIAVSGGSLIEVLHQGLLKRTDIRWGLWDIYFVDERLVPFSDKQSNYGEAKRKIFDLIDIEKYGKPKIFHINESLIDDPLECSDDYESCLIRGFASKDSVRLPTFNLILLGCAPDGHIASLFPNFPESLREKHSWCIPVEKAPSGPSNRISMTIPVICHSQQITFVVEGAVKAPVIKTIIERPEKGLPSSIVNENAAGRVAWFVDEEALTDVFVIKKKYKFLATPEDSDGASLITTSI